MRYSMFVVALFGLLGVEPASAQHETVEAEIRQVMDHFVRGWREGDADLLSSVLALDDGRITWISGQGADERVGSMTFGDAVARDRAHPDYGADGWELLSLDVVDDQLAVVKLRIPEGEAVNIDYMVCQRTMEDRQQHLRDPAPLVNPVTALRHAPRASSLAGDALIV